MVPGLGDAEHHLREGAALAHRIGRPYLEIACLAELGFASKIRPNATTRRRCQEAITLAERHGWGAEPIVAPALVTLAGNLALTGDFDEGERWLRRTERALETDTGPGIRLLVHLVTRLLQAGRGRHQAAFEAFSAVERLQSQLADSHGLASQVTGWLLATQARLGQPNALGDQRAANMATERALALAEPERLVLPFAMIGAGELLEAPAAAPDRPRRPAQRYSRRRPRRLPDGRRPASLTANRVAQPNRAQGPALSADQPLPARDRQRAVGVGAHGQHPRPQHLRQAPGK